MQNIPGGKNYDRYGDINQDERDDGSDRRPERDFPSILPERTGKGTSFSADELDDLPLQDDRY